jgi:polyhydroxyalkanoate synthesis regulator phasin
MIDKEGLTENAITKRMDSLYDGYKLTYAKQCELEQQSASLWARVERIEQRLFALENKTA